MGKVRWAGWRVAVAAGMTLAGATMARADIESDKPAAIVVYPKIAVQQTTAEAPGGGTHEVVSDTVIRLANTSAVAPVTAQCFYVDANFHCSGKSSKVCDPAATSGPVWCDPASEGICGPLPGWNETDFRITLTPGQPIQWSAREGLAGSDLPLQFGVCMRNQARRCGSDADCSPVPGGICTPSNAGTRIPPVAEYPFVGELRCVVIDRNTGFPASDNVLKGEALLVQNTDAITLDVASYNAIGIQALGDQIDPPNVLNIGGPEAEYNGCPNYLIVNHFFEQANNPVLRNPPMNSTISTKLVLIPCSSDYLRQVGGTAIAQYLVFNEFEQRFSTSKAVLCYQEIEMCNIDTPQCANSIFNVGVSGTLTGQTRINPVPAPAGSPSPLSALLGIAVETHTDTAGTNPYHRAAFNLHQQGSRDAADTIILP